MEAPTDAGEHDALVALDLSDIPLLQQRQPVRSDKVRNSKTESLVRRTTRADDNERQAAEIEMKGSNPATTDSVGLQFSAKVVRVRHRASAETGAVALAFISRKRGTVLVRCAYKVCDPLSL